MPERNQVEDVLEAYAAAVRAKDVDAFVSLYTEDVRVFDMWGVWAYEGQSAWRANVAEWFGSLGHEQVAADLADVQAVVGSDVAVLHAQITFRGLSADGEELRSMDNRLTWGLRKDGGAWKIAHEHTSAPVDFETAKAALRR